MQSLTYDGCDYFYEKIEEGDFKTYASIEYRTISKNIMLHVENKAKQVSAIPALG